MNDPTVFVEICIVLGIALGIVVHWWIEGNRSQKEIDRIRKETGR